MSARTLIQPVAVVVVLVVTALVIAGVGQGSPPTPLAITKAQEAREIAAVNHGGAMVQQGEVLFDAHGCDDCHTLAAGNYKGQIGPRLDVQSQGDSAKAVLGNITEPPDDDKGYEAGLMPENYGTRLSKHDLDALAAYIWTAAGGAAGKPGTGS